MAIYHLNKIHFASHETIVPAAITAGLRAGPRDGVEVRLFSGVFAPTDSTISSFQFRASALAKSKTSIGRAVPVPLFPCLSCFFLIYAFPFRAARIYRAGHRLRLCTRLPELMRCMRSPHEISHVLVIHINTCRFTCRVRYGHFENREYRGFRPADVVGVHSRGWQLMTAGGNASAFSAQDTRIHDLDSDITITRLGPSIILASQHLTLICTYHSALHSH